MRGSIADAFASGPAFIPYLAAGDPGVRDSPPGPDAAMDATRSYVSALVDGGADIVELGLPFSEPIADGPTIQQATVRALENGMTPPRFMELVASLPKDVPLVVMTYYNLIYRYGAEPGVEAFVEAAADAGLAGMIVPDLPVEESEELRRACERADIALIFIVAPTTRDDRLSRIMETGSGYVYVQARLGTTGAQVDVSDRTRESLDRIRRFEAVTDRPPIPKAVGFGVSTGAQAGDIVAAGAGGVIVGSALVELLEEPQSSDRDVLARLEAKAREIADGASAGLARRSTGPERS